MRHPPFVVRERIGRANGRLRGGYARAQPRQQARFTSAAGDQVERMHGVSLADPIVSLLIAVLILYSSYGVLRESATVLLEGTPAGMDMPAVIAAIKGVGGVLDVHDLHVWMVGPGVVACSCHILVAEQSVREGQQVLRAVVHDIEHRFNITHTTVQVEVEGCDANDMYCMGQRSGSAVH